MDKKRGIELLIQAVDEIPHLKTLHYRDGEIKLWLDKVENILREGLKPEDYNKYWPVSPRIEILKGIYEDNIYQEEYLRKITDYELALKSILLKYEILENEVETIPIAKENSEQGVMMNKIQPAAFIVHGGRSGVLDKLREFVEALGIKPLIVEMLPSKGMTLADKVKKYQQEADCAIILATRGGIIDTKSGKQHPRLNVIDELSSFHEAFPEKVVVLLEKGAELPSNKAGLTYEPFARQSMDRAFTAIARELTEMKILKAVRPQERASPSSTDTAPVARLI